MPKRKQGIAGVYLWAIYQFVKQLAEHPGPPQLPFILFPLFIHQTKRSYPRAGIISYSSVNSHRLALSLALETLFSE